MAVANAERATPARRSAARLREPLLRGAHILTLSAFALAQPLLDILAKHAEFFAVRGSTPGDIVLFALAVTFLPALVLWLAVVAVSAVHRGVGFVVYALVSGGLFALFVIQALERAGIDATTALIAGAAVAGALAALAIARVSVVRSFLTVLSPAPLVFLVVFLFFSPVTKLVFPDDVELATAQVRADAPVVLMILDELPVVSLLDREGRIDERRYPSFARLARASTWFRNATTLSASTTQAVPALLTGNRPKRGRLPVFQENPRSLFTLLGGRYRLNVTESQTRLCPRELCGGDGPRQTERLRSLYADARIVYAHLVAPPELEDRLPAIDEAWTGFGQDAAAVENLQARTTLPKIDIRTFYVGRVREFKAFVGSLPRADADPPTLNLLHTLFPHGPWLHFPSGRVSAVAQPRAPGREGELWWDEGLALQAYQRHLLQLGYTDRLLGELLDRLERTGLWNRSLVVVLADHGIYFGEGGRRRAPTEDNLDELAFIPLFVKRPGDARGRVVDRHVRIIDVLPTIADALGVELSWKIDGRSAFGSGPEPRRVRVGREAAPLSTALARRAEAHRRQLALFGDGDWDIFALGPYRSLLGRSIDALRPADGTGEAVVDETGSRLLRALPERSPLVPSPLMGTVDGVERGEWLALAVNGRVAALCQAYEGRDGVVRFSALAPEDAFRTGENDARFFLVEGPPGAPRLDELETRLT